MPRLETASLINKHLVSSPYYRYKAKNSSLGDYIYLTEGANIYACFMKEKAALK